MILFFQEQVRKARRSLRMKRNVQGKKTAKWILLAPIVLPLVMTPLLLKATPESRIAFYNVENLFDTEHDVEKGIDKDDWTFLPKKHPGKKNCDRMTTDRYRKECRSLDWTPERLQLKLKQIAKVLCPNPQARPQMVGLAEIENEKVVAKLAKECGYGHAVASISRDERGIDVAMMFNESENVRFIRTQQFEPESDYLEKNPTRPILEVVFQVLTATGVADLSIFVNHWPSQSNDPVARRDMAKLLHRLMSERQMESRPERAHYVIAMGDFNTTRFEKPHPHKDILLANMPSEFGWSDLFSVYRGTEGEHSPYKKDLPNGSYFYDRDSEWNQLDLFFVDNRLLQSREEQLFIPLETVQIIREEFMTKLLNLPRNHPRFDDLNFRRVPLRYNHESLSNPGFSDHLPIQFDLRFGM
jgi:hypothetical protein